MTTNTKLVGRGGTASGAAPPTHVARGLPPRTKRSSSDRSRVATDLRLEGVPNGATELNAQDKVFIDFLARIAVEQTLRDCGILADPEKK